MSQNPLALPSVAIQPTFGASSGKPFDAFAHFDIAAVESCQRTGEVEEQSKTSWLQAFRRTENAPHSRKPRGM